MPIAVPNLPEIGTYPATGTDAQKDQWLRLAAMHVSVANTRATEAVAESNNKLAVTHAEFNALQAASQEYLRDESDRNAEQNTALVGAITALGGIVSALTERLGSLTVGGVGGGATLEGLTDADIDKAIRLFLAGRGATAGA